MKQKTPKETKSGKIENLQLAVFDINGKEVGKLELDKQIFDGKINTVLIHQAVVTYLANKRKGLASTKTRGEVRGGGRKPWRQKGTGRARVGSTRSPLWRKGGTTFGPRPHSFYKDLPKKMRTLALKSSLNAKLNEQKILILDDLVTDSYKTKNFHKILSNLEIDGEKTKFVLESLENNIKLATRNIKKVSLSRAEDIHAMDVLNCKMLILTKGALNKIGERIKNVSK